VAGTHGGFALLGMLQSMAGTVYFDRVWNDLAAAEQDIEAGVEGALLCSCRHSLLLARLSMYVCLYDLADVHRAPHAHVQPACNQSAYDSMYSSAAAAVLSMCCVWCRCHCVCFRCLQGQQ
jgi:hypothetical protein